MISFSKCVVGEAHGFSSSYAPSCQECGRIGSRFAFSFTSHSYPRLEECKQRFVKHWNEKHQMNKIEKDFKKNRYSVTLSNAAIPASSAICITAKYGSNPNAYNGCIAK